MIALTKDSTAAWNAWSSYASQRFKGEYGTEMWFAAYEAFVVEFLTIRGWRRLPGSQEWV